MTGPLATASPDGPPNKAMNTDKEPDILGLSGLSPGGSWSPPLLFGMVLRSELVPLALCGLSPSRWADHPLTLRFATA
jgi:hypothetical protein